MGTLARPWMSGKSARPTNLIVEDYYPRRQPDFLGPTYRELLASEPANQRLSDQIVKFKKVAKLTQHKYGTINPAASFE